MSLGATARLTQVSLFDAPVSGLLRRLQLGLEFFYVAAVQARQRPALAIPLDVVLVVFDLSLNLCRGHFCCSGL